MDYGFFKMEALPTNFLNLQPSSLLVILSSNPPEKTKPKGQTLNVVLL